MEAFTSKLDIKTFTSKLDFKTLKQDMSGGFTSKLDIIGAVDAFVSTRWITDDW